MSAKTYLAISISLLMLVGVFLPQAALVRTPTQITTLNTSPAPAYPNVYRGPHVNEYYITPYLNPTNEFTDLKGGAIDAMEWPLTSSQYFGSVSTPGISTDARYYHNQSSDLSVQQVIFDNGRFPSNHTEWRIAASMMIDVAGLVTTQLGGLGDVMPDQLTPAWPTAMHNTTSGYTPSTVFPYDDTGSAVVSYLNSHGWHYLPCSDLGFSAWNYTGVGVDHNKCVNPADTFFYTRSDDPNRFAIGTQVSIYQGRYGYSSGKHLDLLFTVKGIVSHISSVSVYSAPDCTGTQGSPLLGPSATNYPGLGYGDNCGNGNPAFTMYTQGLSFTTPDPSWMYLTFGQDAALLDVDGFNFGHYTNTTLGTYTANSFATNCPAPIGFSTPCPVRDKSAAAANGLITALAYFAPMYYQKDTNAGSDRVVGTVGGDLTGGPFSPGGIFYFNNWEAYNNAHIAGRTYGGSLRVGDYDLPTQLNPTNIHATWVYEAQIFAQIFGSLMYYDYGTSSLIPGIASNMSVTTLPIGSLLNAPIADGFTGATNGCWSTSASAPYWTKGVCAYTANPTQAMRIDFGIPNNETFTDGSKIDINSLIWNAITDADPSGHFANLLQFNYAKLSDANATSDSTCHLLASTCLTLWYNTVSYDWPLFSALNYVLPPTPWIAAVTRQLGAWAGSTGQIDAHNAAACGTQCSLVNKASLRLGDGGSNMLDSSGPFAFDYANCAAISTCDPFGASGGGAANTFGLKANPTWPWSTSQKTNYNTGIVIVGPYLPSKYTAGSTFNLQVAIVNGANSKGLTWDNSKSFSGSLTYGGHTYSLSYTGDYVPNGITASDTGTASIQVSYKIFGPNSFTTQQASGTLTLSAGLFSGTIDTTGYPAGAYFVQITAHDPSAASIDTVYGPSGTAVGDTSGAVSNAGDPLHTGFLVTALGATPAFPAPLLFVLLASLLIAPTVRRARRIHL